jgi:guanylate kinase
MSVKRGNLIVFTGPSGVGKGTVVKRLFSNISNIEFSISVTTRKQRDNEIHGKNYFFTDREDFEELIANDKLLEHAEFVGNYYGTPKDFVEDRLRKGIDVFLEIEVQGALQVKNKFPEAVMLFLMPPNFEALEERLIKRNTEPMEIIKKRLVKAKEEMKQIDLFDYRVTNDDPERAAKELKEIIELQRVPPVTEKKTLVKAKVELKIPVTC